MTAAEEALAREELRQKAMSAAEHCVDMVVNGDPDALVDGHPSADRNSNAKAALALAQLARTLEERGRR